MKMEWRGEGKGKGPSLSNAQLHLGTWKLEHTNKRSMATNCSQALARITGTGPIGDP